MFGDSYSAKWKVFKFKEWESGIYSYDTENKDDEEEEDNNINNNTIIYYSYIQNVRDNTKFLTKEEIVRALKASRYQYILCWPSTTSYINIVENNIITKCDINSDDIKRSYIIWGHAKSVLQGKTKRKKPNKHNSIPKNDTTSIG